MVLDGLRQQVCDANRSLVSHGLVTLTWGNVSGIDREAGLVAIKPSGVGYDALTPEDMVLVDLEGNVVEGELRPSSRVHALRMAKPWPGSSNGLSTGRPVSCSV